VPPSGSGSAGKVVAIILAAIGVVAVLGVVLGAVGSALTWTGTTTSTRTLERPQIDDLDVDLGAGALLVTFVEGLQQAELEVTGPGGAEGWTLREDDGTLTVSSPNRRWAPWFWFEGMGRAELRLPATERAVDADVDVSAGEFRMAGDFGELDLDLGAGRIVVDGSARELNVTLSAGEANVDLADVREAAVLVNAGSADVRLSGDQPATIDAEANAGRVRITVPAGDYDVRSDVSAGDFDNGIGSQPRADRVVTVRGSAGGVRLTAG